MPAPSVTVKAPPPLTYSDPGVLRPQTLVSHSGATGPTCDVLHEWDTVATFDSGNLIQDSNAGITANTDDVGVPPSDMGPAGTSWFYRVTVTDNNDSASTTSATFTLEWTDATLARRYLYLLTNVGVGYDPIDGTSWTTTPPDGFAIDFRRYLYLLTNLGVGYDPIDGTLAVEGGPDPTNWPGDGYANLFRRYLYLLTNITADTPTPHIWYLFPTFGREGWEFKIVGYGFGDTQATFAGATARLNALTVGILSWSAFAEAASTLIINPEADIAEPIHQEIRATVPTGGQSGLVFVEHDDV